MPHLNGIEASLLMKEYLISEIGLSEEELPAIIGLTGDTGSRMSLNVG